MAHLHGIVLAAGAGTRFGGAKALALDDAGTPWLALASDVLRAAGCRAVTIVLGASADEARALAPPDAEIVVAGAWRAGVSASLRAGLEGARSSEADAVLITLVDLPDLPAAVARRVAERAADADRGVLCQAVFSGRPGHPVLVGRDHWAPLAAALAGDRGARPYLVAHSVDEVECGDLAEGYDVDTR